MASGALMGVQWMGSCKGGQCMEMSRGPNIRLFANNENEYSNSNFCYSLSALDMTHICTNKCINQHFTDNLFVFSLSLLFA